MNISSIYPFVCAVCVLYCACFIIENDLKSAIKRQFEIMQKNDKYIFLNYIYQHILQQR